MLESTLCHINRCQVGCFHILLWAIPYYCGQEAGTCGFRPQRQGWTLAPLLASVSVSLSFSDLGYKRPYLQNHRGARSGNPAPTTKGRHNDLCNVSKPGTPWLTTTSSWDFTTKSWIVYKFMALLYNAYMRLFIPLPCGVGGARATFGWPSGLPKNIMHI